MWAPAAVAISVVASVDCESKTWMSSDQETLARQSGRSRCSSRVRRRAETMWDLWYRDEAKGLTCEKLNESNVSRISGAVRGGDVHFAWCRRHSEGRGLG